MPSFIFKLRILLAGGIIAAAAGMVGCHDCSLVDPMQTAPFRFMIVDSSGKSLADSSLSKYVADSIRIFYIDDNSEVLVNSEYNPIAKGFVFSADCIKNESGTSLLRLHFNAADSDSIRVSYQKITGKCGFHYIYTKLLHNGVESVKSNTGAPFLVIKER